MVAYFKPKTIRYLAEVNRLVDDMNACNIYSLILTPVFDLPFSERNRQSRGVSSQARLLCQALHFRGPRVPSQGRQAPFPQEEPCAMGVLCVGTSLRVGCEHFWGWHWGKYEASSLHALILICLLPISSQFRGKIPLGIGALLALFVHLSDYAHSLVCQQRIPFITEAKFSILWSSQKL